MFLLYSLRGVLSRFCLTENKASADVADIADQAVYRRFIKHMVENSFNEGEGSEDEKEASSVADFEYESFKMKTSSSVSRKEIRLLATTNDCRQEEVYDDVEDNDFAQGLFAYVADVADHSVYRRQEKQRKKAEKNRRRRQRQKEKRESGKTQQQDVVSHPEDSVLVVEEVSAAVVSDAGSSEENLSGKGTGSCDNIDTEDFVDVVGKCDEAITEPDVPATDLEEEADEVEPGNDKTLVDVANVLPRFDVSPEDAAMITYLRKCFLTFAALRT